MELLGIAFSIPISFAASMLYCFFLDRVLLKYEKPSRWLRFSSYFVLALFAAELVAVFTVGAVRSRAILGPSFYVDHLVLFFISVPSLANFLILRRRPVTWYVAGVLCTVFAFFLVLLQYSVSESLYGIDGDNGPYSRVMNDDAGQAISVNDAAITPRRGVNAQLSQGQSRYTGSHEASTGKSKMKCDTRSVTERPSLSKQNLPVWLCRYTSSAAPTGNASVRLS